MDLALAHEAEARLFGGGQEGAAKLGAGRFTQLLLQCRGAKERLLSEGAPESVRVAVLGGGSKLIGGALATDVTRAESDQRIVDQLSARYSQQPQIIQSLETIFGLERRDVTINVDVVTKAYADASATVHFLHLARPADRPAGIRMEEQTEDIFAPFLEMARVTGGYAASTANISAAMREAVAPRATASGSAAPPCRRC